ncbi:MAG: hypothetical protein LBT54_08090 [Bifidobacteriaceae bacterium]|jgi:alternate signal-mediated exported protein|nr:hypothetical protein [Bifidobacteriaceae bacterium]
MNKQIRHSARGRGGHRVRPLVAAGLGAALLTGAIAYALWEDGVIVPGGDTISAGDLSIQAVGSPIHYDVSPDRTDGGVELITGPNFTGAAIMGHVVDLATWRIVPGDVMAAKHDIQVTLVGDNLVANLGVAFGTPSGPGANNLLDQLDLKYQIFMADGAEVTSGPTDLTSPALALVQAESTGQGAADDPGIPVVPVPSGADASVSVLLFATFDATTAYQDYTQATAILGDTTISLEQVRSGGNFS